jgi:hypothetical protein
MASNRSRRERLAAQTTMPAALAPPPAAEASTAPAAPCRKRGLPVRA